MRRSQNTKKLADMKLQKQKKPWIPPGRPSSTRTPGPPRDQVSSIQRFTEPEVRQRGDEEEQEEDLSAISRSLCVLLNEREKRARSQGRLGQVEVLLRALMEAEIDGVAVANQLNAFKECMDTCVKDKRPSSSLARQQQLLLEKMAMFDSSNHSLREVLRESKERQRESLLWLKQKDIVQKRLDLSEAENMRLASKLSTREEEALQLAQRLDLEKDNVKRSEELSKVLEERRAHLESQLERAEAEKLHLSAHVQKLQQGLEQQQEDLLVLQQELQTARLQKEQQEQEEAAQISQHAVRAEECVRKLREQLQEKESQLSQALSSSSDWRRRHSSEAAAKEHLEEQISGLRLQLTELNAQLHSAEDKGRAEREELRDQIHVLTSEKSSMKLDRQRLQAEMASCEEKLREVHSEARLLKSSIRKQEAMLEKYRKKLHQARLQAEEQRGKQEEAQAEEEQQKKGLLGQLAELQTLPDSLRRTEKQLQEAQQEAQGQLRKNMETAAVLSEVRLKVEQQGAELETFQNRNMLLQEENKAYKERILHLERRLEELMEEKQELSQGVLLKDASVHSLQQQLEEKSRESGQLQQAVDHAYRQADSSMQRVLSRERESQSKASDLQNQLSRAKTELNQLQRSKEEMERRFRSQLQNLKERLEQSDSTNRSLQLYVTFLKTSYGNVFGDSFT
ncbi:unnamed protein product [Ophioblennius macclurei]